MGEIAVGIAIAVTLGVGCVAVWAGLRFSLALRRHFRERGLTRSEQRTLAMNLFLLAGEDPETTDLMRMWKRTLIPLVAFFASVVVVMVVAAAA
jgi:hypothetical protein